MSIDGTSNGGACEKRNKGRIAAAIFAAVLTAVLLWAAVTRPQEETLMPPLAQGVLLTIDGYAVPEEEFLLFLQAERALTAAHFFSRYGVQGDADFWSRAFDGQTPTEYAKKAALEELISVKMEAIILHERGLAEDISFEALMADLEQTNQERAEKLARGEVIYGLSRFDPATYYLYIRSQRRGELQRSQLEMASPTESELREIYSKNQDFFQQGAEITYQIDFPDGTSETRVASIATLGKDDIEGTNIFNTLSGMTPGARLEDVLTDGQRVNVTLLAVQALGVMPFDAVEGRLTSLYAEEQLQELLAERIQKASLVINHEAYDAIVMP